MQQVAGQLTELQQRHQIEPVLDELEYLYEVMAPELQDAAEHLIEVLRERLERANP